MRDMHIQMRSGVRKCKKKMLHNREYAAVAKFLHWQMLTTATAAVPFHRSVEEALARPYFG